MFVEDDCEWLVRSMVLAGGFSACAVGLLVLSWDKWWFVGVWYLFWVQVLLGKSVWDWLYAVDKKWLGVARREGVLQVVTGGPWVKSNWLLFSSVLFGIACVILWVVASMVVLGIFVLCLISEAGTHKGAVFALCCVWLYTLLTSVGRAAGVVTWGVFGLLCRAILFFSLRAVTPWASFSIGVCTCVYTDLVLRGLWLWTVGAKARLVVRREGFLRELREKFMQRFLWSFNRNV